ncbi:TIR domain-containing protein [Methanolacinia paynteri]|uniref:TIR domain-containing protein n=1 Tax=Methanolacinia paynteri TaxID=230356 RepID=UPI00064F8673|nr:TIR domain-containing protein [Methanolacinia paynteri]
MTEIKNFECDFAISYAGEDLDIAEGIKKAITEKNNDFTIFFAPDERYNLIGKDGETFFEKIFKNSKQVILLLSESYKKKDWTRFELDEILKRNEENRFIPVKIDEVNILGLSSNIIYIPFSENYIEIAEIAIKKLLKFEMDNGFYRETEYQKAVSTLKNSKGSLDKAYQLMVDNRERETPLKDIEYPKGDFRESYSIYKIEDISFSKIPRIQLRINLPPDLSKEAVIYNLKHCNATIFNEKKPEAIVIFAYSDEASNFPGFDDKFNVGKSEFALYGDWGRAEEGFVYNMPVEKFDYNIQFEESYFDKKLKISAGSDIARDLAYEMFESKIIDEICESPDIKTRGLSEKLKIKPDEIRKMLKKLQKRKMIKKVGSKNIWHWEIIHKR